MASGSSAARAWRCPGTMGGVAEDPGNADVLQAVREVDWAAYPMPSSESWYEPGDIPAAFRRLVAVSNQQEGGAACSAVLFAIGNNHAGYLVPAAAPAAPLLVRVAREHQGWVCQTALEILIECVEFGVDPEQFVDPSGAVAAPKTPSSRPCKACARTLNVWHEKRPASAPTQHGTCLSGWTTNWQRASRGCASRVGDRSASDRSAVPMPMCAPVPSDAQAPALWPCVTCPGVTLSAWRRGTQSCSGISRSRCPVLRRERDVFVRDQSRPEPVIRSLIVGEEP